MYKRIVLKLSGEALAGSRGFGLDADKVAEITGEVAEVHALGVEIGIVVGGGNFFRGVAEQTKEMDRVAADNMGMLSTVMNAIALQDALEQRGVQCCAKFRRRRPRQCVAEAAQAPSLIV